VKKLVAVIGEAVQRFFADQCPQLAAGIAYRVLFSIVPLAIVLVSIFGLILQNDSIRHDVVNAIVDALPVSADGRQKVENAITDLATPASAAGFVSLLVFAWAATGMMGAIRRGLETAMHVPESRPIARAKLVDLALVVGAAALVLVTAGITLLGDLLQKVSDRFGDVIDVRTSALAGLVLRGLSFVLVIVVVLVLYRFVPARGLRVRDGIVGATVTAVASQLISFASGLIYERTTNLSVVYGSLTAALVFLYSMYLYASALLLGAEVAAGWSQPPTGPAEPIRTQLKRGILGLFVTQKPSQPGADASAPPPRTPR
jgi:membrane protein